MLALTLRLRTGATGRWQGTNAVVENAPTSGRTCGGPQTSSDAVASTANLPWTPQCSAGQDTAARQVAPDNSPPRCPDLLGGIGGRDRGSRPVAGCGCPAGACHRTQEFDVVPPSKLSLICRRVAGERGRHRPRRSDLSAGHHPAHRSRPAGRPEPGPVCRRRLRRAWCPALHEIPRRREEFEAHDCLAAGRGGWNLTGRLFWSPPTRTGSRRS